MGITFWQNSYNHLPNKEARKLMQFTYVQNRSIVILIFILTLIVLIFVQVGLHHPCVDAA